MRRRIAAQKLIKWLYEKLQSQLNLESILILGVVLKGLPVAYSMAKMNDVVENFVPIVAQRHMFMQHRVESYFPSLKWKDHFNQQLSQCKSILVVDDVVNTGFTKQRVESIVHSLNSSSVRFAAMILNRKNLANPNFVGARDIFAREVNATDVECDWGLITVPLWDLSVDAARQRCEEYYQKFWVNEKRMVTITY